MPCAELHVDEINYETEPQTIGDVAGDAGEQQGECAEDTVIRPRRTPEKVDDQNGRDHRDDRQTPSAGVALIVQHRKCDTGILCVREI